MAFKSNNLIIGWGTLLALLLLAGSLQPAPAAPAIQELPAEYDLSTQAQSPSGKGSVQISFGSQAGGQGYRLQVDPADLRLLRRTGRGEDILATLHGVGLADAKEHAAKITIQRREGKIAVLFGSRLVMDVEDSAFNQGSGDTSTSGDATCSPLRLQPVEALYFTDDFMRQPTEPGEWTYHKGTWSIQTIGVAERGANPFSLESRPAPMALASAGHPFWSHYLFQAAVKGSKDTTLGISVDLQDPQNYYLLRWSPGAAGALELLRVVDGAAASLGRVPGGFIPNLWYQLGLKTSGGRLIAEVDHHQVFNLEDTTFGMGKVGLYAEGGGDHIVWFDSVLVRDAGVVYDDFSPNTAHHWQLEGDQALGGSPQSKNYTVTAEVTGSREPMALPFHYRDSQNYYLFGWGAGESHLGAVVNGKHRLIASTPQGLDPGKRYTLQVGAEDGYLWAAIDGKQVLEGLDFDLHEGRAGFQPADAAGKSFRSLEIAQVEPPEPTDALTTEFTQVAHHPDMLAWAGPLHAWETASLGGDNGYWHKGSLYGSVAIQVPLRTKELQDGSFGLLLNTDGSQLDSGYELDYKAKGAAGIDLSLLRQGQQVASGHLNLPAGADTKVLEVYRQGSFIYAGSGQEMPLRYRDPHPLDGYALPVPVGYAGDEGGHSKLGLVLRAGTSLDVPQILVRNNNVYAETFHLAPVHWRTQGGDWEVTRRWACQPGWTWYGGKGHGYVADWYKAPLWGSQTIDYYTGAMMNALPEAGVEAWRDLNCSFCSDGVNLFSGYTLMVCGWNGATTRLFRKGKQVAESSTFHFPPQDAAHRLWFDVHILKRGGSIRSVISYADPSGQIRMAPLVNWTDPDPLPGGMVGFWTYQNGMMLARVVISAQQQGQPPLYKADPVWVAEAPASTPYPQTPDAGVAAIAQPDLALLQPPPILVASNAAPPSSGTGAVPDSSPHVALNPQPNPPHSGQGPETGPSPREPGVPVTTDTVLAAADLSMTVEPGGTLKHVRFRGQEVLRGVVLDIRDANWHQVKLTNDNSHVEVFNGNQPGVSVRFQIDRPDLAMKISGWENVEVLPQGMLRVRAGVNPGSTFQSNRVSVNLVIPAADYTGKQLVATAGNTQRTLPVPDQPLFPIQFATNIRHLTLPGAMEVKPLDGMGVLEDLRHFEMGEFWFEQQADYPYPNVPQGQAKSFGVEVRFGANYQ